MAWEKAFQRKKYAGMREEALQRAREQGISFTDSQTDLLHQGDLEMLDEEMLIKRQNLRRHPGIRERIERCNKHVEYNFSSTFLSLKVLEHS